MTLRKRTMSAGRWTAASALGRTGLQIMQVAIVARVLSPDDFGLMAIVVALLAVMALLADFGANRAIIHFQDVDADQLSALYWFNVIVAASLSAAIALVAPVVSEVYAQPELAPVLMATAPVLFLTALGQQFCVLAEKELRFPVVAQNEVAAAVIGFLACVVSAVWIRAGVYALVAGALASSATVSMLAWVRLSGPHRPRFRFNRRGLGPFLRFGGYLVGENMASTLARQADVFVGGILVSSTALGLYSVPRDLSLRLAMTINQIVTRVGFPVMSQIKEDRSRLREVYLQTLRMTTSANFPLYVALGVFADEVINLLYGPRFAGAAVLLRWLAAWGLLRSIGNPSGSLLYAVGRTRLAFWWNVGQLLLLPLLYWTAARKFGVEGLAASLLLSQCLLLVPTWRWLIRPCCGASFGEYVGVLALPLIAALIAGGAAWLGTNALPHGTLRLAVGGAIGVAVYCGLSAWINPSWWTAILELLFPKTAHRP